MSYQGFLDDLNTRGGRMTTSEGDREFLLPANPPICSCCGKDPSACERGGYRSDARENARRRVDAPARGTVAGSVRLDDFVAGMIKPRGK
jgi:hypothetical protein